MDEMQTFDELKEEMLGQLRVQKERVELQMKRIEATNNNKELFEVCLTALTEMRNK